MFFQLCFENISTIQKWKVPNWQTTIPNLEWILKFNDECIDDMYKLSCIYLEYLVKHS